jgi:hypothetical protein
MEIPAEPSNAGLNHTAEVEPPPPTKPEYEDEGIGALLPHFAFPTSMQDAASLIPSMKSEDAAVVWPEQMNLEPERVAAQGASTEQGDLQPPAALPISIGSEPLSSSLESLSRRAHDPHGEPASRPAAGSPRWPMILLASYASAVTLGMLFLIAQNHQRRSSDTPAFFPITHDSRPEQHSPAKLTSWIANLVPIADENRFKIGETRTLGELEITPRLVEWAAVTLIHVAGERESRDGGNDALQLSLEIKNLSQTRMIRPIDLADLREQDRGASQSVIITGPNSVIGNYPLARESEWAIDGQEFPALQPGASASYRIVSEPEVRARCTSQMLWRLPLRLAPDRTEWIGIIFDPPETP